MANIKATPNKDGRVIVKLYGKDHDVTELVDNGVAILKAFGKKFTIEVKNKRASKTTQSEPEPEEQPVEENEES